MQNVHPLFVHFPIAFLVTAAAAELAHAAWRRKTLDALARWSLYLGTLGAVAAAVTGWLAAGSAAPVAAARDALGQHRLLTFVVTGLAAALAFWRLSSARRGGPRPRAVFVVALVGLAALLFAAAREGGELVHDFGVGTRLTAPGGPLAEPDSGAAHRATPATGRPVPQSSDFR
jgi:uncharacterized membrane protein